VRTEKWIREEGAPSELAAEYGAPLGLVVLLAQQAGQDGLGHCASVARGVGQIGLAMGMGSAEVRLLALAGLLHDVGKTQIPAAILDKAGPLDAAEWAQIRRHPKVGAELATLHGVPKVSEWILAHHERPDGKGYPFGLRGEEIPLQARILAVVDTFDAMTSHRPYRAAFSTRDAVDELIEVGGTQLDAEVVRTFCRLGPRLVLGADSERRRWASARAPRSPGVACTALPAA
jgi:putative nucleotidyltransferase with HDIG domain